MPFLAIEPPGLSARRFRQAPCARLGEVKRRCGRLLPRGEFCFRRNRIFDLNLGSMLTSPKIDKGADAKAQLLARLSGII